MKPLMLDTFSGIGGFSLAGAWAGFDTAAFIEIEPFCQAVLRKNFPGVPIHADIKEFHGESLRGRISVVCGGFPCQPFSVAGKAQGEKDSRYLWPELIRVIREVNPAFCLLENVPGLRNIAADRVLQDLEEAGYSAEPFVVGADDIGATHRRKRVWIVAKLDNADEGGFQGEPCGPSSFTDSDGETDGLRIASGCNVADTTRREAVSAESGGLYAEPAISGRELAYAGRELRGAVRAESGEDQPLSFVHDQRRAAGFPPARNDFRGWAAVASVDAAQMPCVEREIRRSPHGIPRRLDGLTGNIRNHRLKGLGNAVVPQVAYLFLKWIREEIDRCLITKQEM